MKTILILLLVIAQAGCQNGSPSAKVATATKAEFRIIATHPVQKGETLSSICRKYYGKADHDTLSLVTKANPEILMESTGSPQPHMTLRIPALPNDER